MQKTRSTLLHFFSKPLVDALLPHVIDAERSTFHGEEKKTHAIGQFEKTIASDGLALPTPEGNLSIPWRVLFPVLIDAFIRILNIIVGKEWIKEEEEPSAPPGT